MPAVKIEGRDDGLTRLVEAAPSLTAIAKTCGVSRPAVSRWTRVPVAHVLKLEREYGLSRHDLRPDIYPRPTRRR